MNIYIYIYIYIVSITYTVEKKRKCSYNFLLIIVPCKHGNTLLSEISSFYLYALFRKFRKFFINLRQLNVNLHLRG